MSNSHPPLKPGWKWVKFGDVARQVKDKVDPETSGLERYVAGDHMDTDDLRIRRWGDIGSGYLGPAFHMRFQPGQVLYGSRRTYLRKVAVADFTGITANTTFVIESRDSSVLVPEFLPFLMQTEDFHAHSIKQSKGSVNPYINFTDLVWFEFELPPINEQIKIVSTLQSIECAIDSYAALGISIEKLLESTRDKYFHKATNTQKRLGDFGTIRYGVGQPPKQIDNGIPMIRATNIDRGRISHNDLMRVDSLEIPASRRTFLSEGDIIVVRSGAYTGDSALIGREWIGALAGYDLVVSLDQSKVDPRYIAEFLLSRRTVVSVLTALSARSAQPHINADDLSGVTVPIVDLSSQRVFAEECVKLRNAIERATVREDEMAKMKRFFISSYLTNN